MAPKLKACVRVVRDKFRFEYFTGSDNILAVLADGSFRVSNGGDFETVNALNAFCFEKGVRYHRFVETPISMYLFRFSSDSKIFKNSVIEFNDKRRIRSTLELLEKTDSELFRDEFMLKESLFGDIITQYRIENSSISNSELIGDPIIQKAVLLMQSSSLQLSLTDIAKSVNLSYVQFSRRFKAATNMTPFDYIAKLRIKKARQLLSNTDLTIAEISAVMDFSSEYYFSNFFKKHLGISPSAFRGD